MTVRSYHVGTTRRGSADPLRHAFTWRRRTPTGRTYAALCGAGVYLDSRAGSFDPAHPRACRACASELAR